MYPNQGQQGYGMPQQGYGMPQQGHGMPQQGYGMPQQGYGMPQQGYGMPQMQMQQRPVQKFGGTLSVNVQSAKNLKSADLNGLSDPYCVLSIQKNVKQKKNKSAHKTKTSKTKTNKVKKPKIKTSVKKNTLNPVWNQKFNLKVTDAVNEHLEILIYDYDSIGDDDIIGWVIIPLAFVVMGSNMSFNLKVNGGKGTIAVTICAMGFGYPQQNLQYCMQQTTQRTTGLVAMKTKQIKDKKAKKMKKKVKKVGKVGKGILKSLLS